MASPREGADGKGVTLRGDGIFRLVPGAVGIGAPQGVAHLGMVDAADAFKGIEDPLPLQRKRSGVSHVPRLAAAAFPGVQTRRGDAILRRAWHSDKRRLAEASPVRCNPAFHGFAGNGAGYEYHPAVRKPSNPLEFGTDPGNFNAWHTICAS